MPFDSAGWNDWGGDDWRPERPITPQHVGNYGMVELSAAIAAFWAAVMGAAVACYFARWLR